jgi:gamma-D-glutamyl-L-lysine dipeptidyl-peptidase
MMQFGFCDLAVIPVRKEPADKAEMTTQLLFGDIVEIIDRAGAWLNIRNFFDGYVGWIDEKQIQSIENEEYLRLSTAPVRVNKQLFSDTVACDGRLIRLPAGCTFYGPDDRVMNISGKEYRLEGTAFPFVFNGTEEILRTAENYLDCPYLWGGKTCFGLDCSGLTQVVYKQHGISLLRDAVQQASQGEIINLLIESRPGDLVFFDNSEGTIVHVGILISDHEILHCSGRVRIDTIDHEGIFNRDLNRYTHRLRLIKRVVGQRSAVSSP